MSVAIVLNEEMERNQRQGLIRMAETMKKKEGDENPINVRDSNLMFGWEIFYLRLRKYGRK